MELFDIEIDNSHFNIKFDLAIEVELETSYFLSSMT